MVKATVGRRLYMVQLFSGSARAQLPLDFFGGYFLRITTFQADALIASASNRCSEPQSGPPLIPSCVILPARATIAQSSMRNSRWKVNGVIAPGLRLGSATGIIGPAIKASTPSPRSGRWRGLADACRCCFHFRRPGVERCPSQAKTQSNQ
jgi:hypothetical protein